MLGTYKNFGIVLLVVIIVFTIFAVTYQVNADYSLEGSCIYDEQGVYYFFDGREFCINATQGREFGCLGEDYFSYYMDLGGEPTLIQCGYLNFQSTPSTLEHSARCKFFSVSDGYVGGTIEVSGLGAPSMLRLKNENGTYKLPVLVDTIKRDDTTGQWTAEFSTRNLSTSQPLVPEGTYDAGCFGTNGTADGSGKFTVVIYR